MKSFLFDIGNSFNPSIGIGMCVRIIADNEYEAVSLLRKGVKTHINATGLVNVPGLESIDIHLHSEVFNLKAIQDSEEVEDDSAKKA